jgi:hypothetical protein
MATAKRTAVLCVSLGLVLALGLCVPFKHAANAQAGGAVTAAVIISRNSSQTDISLSLLTRVFGGDPTEFGGHRLIPFNYATDNPVRRVLDLVLLGLESDAVSRYWIDRRIRGKGLAPRTVPSAQVMKIVVAQVPGAIGYIPADQVDTSVLVLTIDSKSPGDRGYPLSRH